MRRVLAYEWVIFYQNQKYLLNLYSSNILLLSELKKNYNTAAIFLDIDQQSALLAGFGNFDPFI